MASVLLAGATGTLGRHVAALLSVRGHRVRALARPGTRLDALRVDERVGADLIRPETLLGVCDGIDIVISCAGASMNLTDVRNRRSFEAIDHAGNRRLLEEAERAGIARFIYVSLFGARKVGATEYAGAHLRFEEKLQASFLQFAIIRPTGYFAFMAEILKMAQRGYGVVIGDGSARTNPVHEADVAEACVDAMASPEELIEIGGPDVFTRREIVNLAGEVAGRRMRVVHLPSGVFHALSRPVRVLNPRIGALLEFGTAASLTDMAAPAIGTRDLRTYFHALAGTPIAATGQS